MNKSGCCNFILSIKILLGLSLVFNFNIIYCQCYKNERNNGIESFKKKDYESSVNFFRAAQKCKDCPQKNDLPVWVNKAYKAYRKSLSDKDWRYKFDYTSPFFEDRAYVMKKKLYGFVDTTGKLITPVEFQDAWPFMGGMAKVRKNDFFGFINKRGILVIDTDFKVAKSFRNGVAYVSDGNLWGLIDSTGKTLLPMAYNFIDTFACGMARVRIDSSYGYIDSLFHVVISPQYKTAEPFEKNVAKVSPDGIKTGYVGKDGEKVLPLVYDKIIRIENNLFIVSLNNKSGVVDIENNILIPVKYDNIKHFKKNWFIAERKMKKGIITLENKVILPVKYQLVEPRALKKSYKT